jgi:hypothetical protein
VSLTRVLRIPRFALCVAIVTIPWLVGIAVSPNAPWHRKEPLATVNLVAGNTLTFRVSPTGVNTYVWEKTDFGPWLQKTYSFNVSGGSVPDKADRLFDAVIRHDPGLRTFVRKPEPFTAATAGSNIVGTMTLSRALDLLTAGTACRWEIADQSVLSVFCNERPILQPQTQARFLAEFHGRSNAINCLERYFADLDGGPDADFDISAGDAAVTVAQWYSVVVNKTCQDHPPGVLLPYDILAGHQTHALQGRYTVGRAIRIMLEGSGLRLAREDEAWRVTAATEPDPHDS